MISVLKTKKILVGFLVFSVLAGLTLAVFRTVLLYRYFDPYANTFTLAAEPFLTALGYGLAVCLLIAFCSMIFLRKREFAPISSSTYQFSVFASSLLGCLFAAAGVLSLIYYPKEIFSQRGTLAYRLFLLAAFFSLFFAAIYFILNSSARFEGAKLKTVLSFFPTIFAITYLSTAYLSPDFVFSDSNDVLRNVSLAALSFFLIQETRTAVYGKSDTLRFGFSLVAIISILAYNIPSLIVTAFWEMELTFMTMFELVECGAVVYAISVARTLIIGLLAQKSEAATEPANV